MLKYYVLVIELSRHVYLQFEILSSDIPRSTEKKSVLNQSYANASWTVAHVIAVRLCKLDQFSRIYFRLTGYKYCLCPYECL
jgi:hypothetical protein